LALGRHLSERVAGKHVVVEYEKHDRYRRIIGKVMRSGEDVNLKQIEADLAWHYKKYAREQSVEDQERYAQAEV
jgi:endonuclease YncB( thermonuclease family)